MHRSIRLAPNSCPYLTTEIYDKLLAENITNSILFLSQNLEELSSKTRISYKILQNICKALTNSQGPVKHSGLDLYNNAVNTAAVLPTGYKCLDEILGGGLLRGEVIELCTTPDISSYFLCLPLSLHVASQINKNVLYLDPSHSIQAASIASMMTHEKKQKDIETALSRIHILHPNTIWNLLQILEELINEESELFKHIQSDLIIIDSLPLLIYPQTTGSKVESFGILNHLSNTLMKVVKLRQTAALIVNYAEKSSSSSISAASCSILMPTLGRYWAHVPHTRLIMEKNFMTQTCIFESKKSTKKKKTPEEIYVTIVKSTRLGTGSCLLKM